MASSISRVDWDLVNTYAVAPYNSVVYDGPGYQGTHLGPNVQERVARHQQLSSVPPEVRERVARYEREVAREFEANWAPKNTKSREEHEGMVQDFKLKFKGNKSKELPIKSRYDLLTESKGV